MDMPFVDSDCVLQVWWSVEDGIFSGIALILMILFVLIFTFELIITAIVFAKIFKNVINAVLFAIVIWLFNYAVFGVILKRYWDVHGHYALFILMVFFSNQIPYSMQLFHRIIDEPQTIAAYDIGALYISAIVCALIYIMLLVLLQWRMPGRLISRRMLYKRRRKEMEIDNTLIHLGRLPSWHNFEFGDVGSKEVIRLRHVYTTHSSSERKILKNISMRIYTGEVYVLLGHIGSGKLTLLRVICGLKYAIRGSVHYMGEDFYNDMKKHRKLVDFRSEENGLCPHLSIEQTINYHVRLKLNNQNSDRYNLERNKWIAILETHVDNRRTRINNLTYGERRLVALCCALAGDTKVIVFEEPTQDMTAHEAQVFWSIIATEKEERAFIIATYSIDETEAVADRIGILSMGVLEASGTPFFLRAKFSSCVELVSR